MAKKQAALDIDVGEPGGVGRAINGNATVGIADDEILENAIRIAAETNAGRTRRWRAVG